MKLQHKTDRIWLGSPFRIQLFAQRFLGPLLVDCIFDVHLWQSYQKFLKFSSRFHIWTLSLLDSKLSHYEIHMKPRKKSLSKLRFLFPGIDIIRISNLEMNFNLEDSWPVRSTSGTSAARKMTYPDNIPSKIIACSWTIFVGCKERHHFKCWLS